MLSHLVPHKPSGRLEVGAGLGGELVQMTQTMSKLQDLAASTFRNARINQSSQGVAPVGRAAPPPPPRP